MCIRDSNCMDTRKNVTGKIGKESYGMDPTGKKEKRKFTWIEEIQTILREREFNHFCFRVAIIDNYLLKS